MILGVDEVGRGSWAGPLVIGAVVLGGVKIEGLTDSKKLSKKRREGLDKIIRSNTTGVGLGWVSASEIDEIGLSSALNLATRRAVEQITAPYSEIIIDGTVNFLKDTNKAKYVSTMKKADLLVPSVSAASIVAKVARDKYMSEQDKVYPGYGFQEHVGYGTEKHRKAIDKLGVTPEHRLSIAPLKSHGSVRSHTNKVENNNTTTKDIGSNGEDSASEYLTKLGHEIIERNWKTKLCEIDIISIKNDVLFFIEVKYRKNAQQGGGLSAITTKKLRQMKFASELYAVKHKINNDRRLAVISVTGIPARVEQFLEVN